MRLLFLFSLVGILAFPAQAQTATSNPPKKSTAPSAVSEQVRPGQFSTIIKHDTVWFAITTEMLTGIDPRHFVSMAIVGPEDGEELFGEAGKNGAMVYTLKEAVTQEWVDGLALRAQIQKFYAVPLTITLKDFGEDGKLKQPNIFYGIKTDQKVVPVSHDFLMNLSPAWLKGVEILRGNESISKFGDAASHGAVLVQLKPEYEAQALKSLE